MNVGFRIDERLIFKRQVIATWLNTHWAVTQFCIVDRAMMDRCMHPKRQQILEVILPSRICEHACLKCKKRQRRESEVLKDPDASPCTNSA